MLVDAVSSDDIGTRTRNGIPEKFRHLPIGFIACDLIQLGRTDHLRNLSIGMLALQLIFPLGKRVQESPCGRTAEPDQDNPCCR